MENIQLAVTSAADSKPVDFKSHIFDALQAKVYDALQTRKVEVAGALFRDNDESNEDNLEQEFQSSSEGNVDEDL
jgi:hypothetical protein